MLKFTCYPHFFVDKCPKKLSVVLIKKNINFKPLKSLYKYYP